MSGFDKSIVKESFFRIGKGVIISVLVTLFLLFIFSLILTFTSVSESIIKPVIIIVTIISILIGSSICTLKINNKGIINGGLVGVFYCLIIYILSSVLGSGFSLKLESIIMILLVVIAGMIGGIIGVNL